MVLLVSTALVKTLTRSWKSQGRSVLRFKVNITGFRSNVQIRADISAFRVAASKS